MLQPTDKIKVRGRYGVKISYVIPSQHIYRSFKDEQIQEIPLQELKDLMYEKGGKYLLENSLVIDNEEALKELGFAVEPEYFYDKEDVKKILLEGSLDELSDCIDFGTDGVRDLIQQVSLETRLPDNNKREMIKEKIGFDITAHLQIVDMSKDETEEEKKPEKTRKAATPKTRKTTKPNKKVEE